MRASSPSLTVSHCVTLSLSLSQLGGVFAESQANARVLIDDIEPLVFAQLLAFLYTDTLPPLSQLQQLGRRPEPASHHSLPATRGSGGRPEHNGDDDGNDDGGCRTSVTTVAEGGNGMNDKTEEEEEEEEEVRVHAQILRHARTHSVGKSQSCML